MKADSAVNILLVDDQPAKLLTYEVILRDLGENLLVASSGKDALETLLKNEVAVVLVDVCMPELDGFELATMIRSHPRFQRTAIIFISAIHLTDVDRLRGYEMGAVDYVPVPVIPEVLRAKVRVFADLYRKTRELENLNAELEKRVAERTSALANSNHQLLQSEQRRSLALAAGNMGSWDCDVATGQVSWDDGQYRIFGVDRGNFDLAPDHVMALIHPEDRARLQIGLEAISKFGRPFQTEFRVIRPNGETRHCFGAAAASIDPFEKIVGLSGVTVDITDRTEAEEHQTLLAREVDHRAKNILALVQSFVRLTHADSIKDYVEILGGRIKALSKAHTVLSQSRWQGADFRTLIDEELAPYMSVGNERVAAVGQRIFLQPAKAQTLALAIHELATNSAKYGALSSVAGKIELRWAFEGDHLVLHWIESGGPQIRPPITTGFGTRIIISSIERQLGGKTHFVWHSDGLQCVILIPRDVKMDLYDSSTGEAVSIKESHASDGARALKGHRVMIVEDEVLVAIALARELEDLGFVVVGKYSRMADAMSAAHSNECDFAVLDINLDGEMVYPVADALIEREIPFVFITGYGADGIDARFGGAPVLQKPVDVESLRNIFSENGMVCGLARSIGSRVGSP
jgi:PAS domain S-box-containing protein